MSSSGKITLHDLKRCKLANVFFDTFFNIEKYLDHEQKEQASLLRVRAWGRVTVVQGWVTAVRGQVTAVRGRVTVARGQVTAVQGWVTVGTGDSKWGLASAARGGGRMTAGGTGNSGWGPVTAGGDR